MPRRDVFATFGLLCALTLACSAQTPVCAAKLQSSMACDIPQIYGLNGFDLPNPAHEAHFSNGALVDYNALLTMPVNTSVGTGLTLLSLPSPASGVIFTTDPTLGTVIPSNESYGPILSERAETIGKHRIYVAATYQFFDFSSLDGISLKHLPVVFTHAQFTIGGVHPIYEEDYIKTQDRIDLKAHQVTLYGTYGLTNSIDVSVAVPILDVSLGITSAATIVRVAPQPVPVTDPTYPSTDGTGYYHFFDLANPATSTSKIFSNSSRASGIGDVVYRVKGTVLKRERAKLALGLDLRAPTGDAKNFLGSGSTGVKTFAAASYRARVSPHANLGFEWNGQSILEGNLTTDTTGKLPNAFFYSGGVDVGITKRWTVAADLLGTRLSSSERVHTTGYVDVDGAPQPGVQQLTSSRDAVNMVDMSLGTKFSLVGNLLLTANVLFKLNDAGLRANVVPLVGLSYSF